MEKLRPPAAPRSDRAKIPSDRRIIPDFARGLHNRILTGAVLAAIALALAVSAGSARAWDSRIHENIVTLAVQALPPSPMSDYFSRNQIRLQDYAVEPDTVLKKQFGKTEEIRHYLDIEVYRPNEFNALDPSYNEMVRQFGLPTLIRSGTLPWTIEDESRKLRDAWTKGDCGDVLRQAGYLAHYVSDASQPLHSTIYYDGYPEDKGIHRRIESAADNHATLLWREDRDQVHIMTIASPWAAAIDEIRDAHGYVDEIIQADRAARAASEGDTEKYEKMLMDRERPLFEKQIARAASVLASIWLSEWQQAASPDKCAAVH